ncbi:energy-coupling factor ABC transporter ATP-binding protein [Gardnerella vaginalis]|uniref:energy-coupling factor ABC transporter ATP-binding protein n=1 Tax=Gardnerella vaginalis TaxID=2702 RepID=UPI00035340D7|nr:ATP-binding cassette domain-containing protein [Gardnerella vaginalis]EPI57765.1 ABC transporter, ATP-binding protein [Gardnerella vaginalis JCP7275]
MAAIHIEHLKYRYPYSKTLALNDISCDIHKGEFIGIIGSNGAGKSTLSQAILGLVPNLYHGAHGGKVEVDGLNAKTTPIDSLCKKVGLVFQNPFNQITGSKLTVYEEIAFGLENLGIEQNEMQSRVEKIMDMLNIAHLKDCSPYDLSGGQMQRMSIAAILVMQPEVIILDEPTSQLDPKGSEEVFKSVESLKNQGQTIIMVEHKMEKIAQYSDRVMLLSEGKLIDFDTPQKIFSREDLEEYGVNPPVYTQICKKLSLKNNNGLYPITLEQTSQILSSHEGNRL